MKNTTKYIIPERASIVLIAMCKTTPDFAVEMEHALQIAYIRGVAEGIRESREAFAEGK